MTMKTTIEQQVAMDEALVPHAQRLRTGRSNFRLLSDIKSKESTLQLVYDVLCICPFFKAFLVTADVSKIYMQEFWATATVHHHAIQFKMDNKKHIMNLESFRYLSEVEHKNHKKSNEMYNPRFTKVINHHFMSKDLSIPRRNKVNWHYVRDDHMFSAIKLVSKHQNTQQFGALLPIELTNEEIRNSKAYKEYYAVATGEAAPKPKATKASKAKSLSALSKVAMTKAQQLKLATKRGLQQTHISQASGSGNDNKGNDDDDDEEDDGDDGEEGNGDDDEDDDGDEGDDDDQEVRRDDDKDDEEEGDGEKDLGLNIGKEERHAEVEEEDELYRDVNINQGRGIQATLEVEDSHMTLTLVNPDGMELIFETTSQMDVQTHTSVGPLPMTAPIMTSSTITTTFITSQRENDEFLKTVDENIKKIIKEQVKEQVKVQVSKILPRIKQDMNEQLEAEVLTRSSHSSKTSYDVAADLSEMELKKILIEKIEGNKSNQLSDEQRNLYKALVEAYESDKIILDTYEETVTLKRRRDDDSDKDEEPFAGPDRGSKRCREGKEPMSAGAPKEKATMSTDKSTHGSRSRQASASDFLINRLKVDTLTSELLAGPTYELMNGSCKSLVELKYHLKEVFKATTDQLDWVNPEGQQYPHNLLKPLPLIPNNRGRHLIPFEHFINNELEYLRGGALSRKYTTSIMKTKAADYGHIKWIKDLVPRTMWIKEPIGYDKHALSGVSHWGRKHQQFYGFAVNQEFARYVYSKRRIITVTELKIVEWHSYKHLD
nr:hypothetical protein [Tanacetum cinerariifolium]